MGLFDRFKKGLEKSRNAVWGKLGHLFSTGRLDESVYEAMEESLISADIGVETSLWLVEDVRKQAGKAKIDTADALPQLLTNAMVSALQGVDSSLHFAKTGPTLYLIVGVNGVGKTTSIAKLAHRFQSEGKKVVLAAGDTFRAAAIEQLVEWGNRVGCDVIRHANGSDPAAVVFDAIAAAKSRKADVILCDTAGRLHNKANLMAELAKIHKVAVRELPGSPHEVLLVLDGTTGQNALSQAKVFQDVVGVSGIVLTKLDGTAKGGIVLPIVREFQIPVKLVGFGEQMDDLELFDAQSFATAICQP